MSHYRDSIAMPYLNNANNTIEDGLHEKDIN